METVKVAVRCRPLSKKELADGYQKVVDVDSDNGQISVTNPKSNQKPKSFTFDYAYGEDSSQKQVYDQCASQIIKSVLEGRITALKVSRSIPLFPSLF